MRALFSRRRLLVLLGVLPLVVAAPVAVFAATSHHFNGATERQSARWTSADATTSGTAWQNVPGFSLTRCTLGEIAETISVTVSGGPVRFRGVIDDVPEAPMKPGIARFVPNGTEAFSYTFVANTGPFEADDTHRFAIQWQSPTGAPITLHRGIANLVFKRGTHACP
jgi:hypothetical protein